MFRTLLFRGLPVLFLGLVASTPALAHELFAEVRTDYRPFVDFTTVRITLTSPVLVAADVRDYDVSPGDRFDLGVRIAEYAGLETGEYRATVELRNECGSVIATRLADILLTDDFGVTFLVSADLPRPEHRFEKSVMLLEDADLDGGFSAGDVVRYSVLIATPCAASFTDTPDPGGQLIPGTVTASRGLILQGNEPGDQSITVNFFTLLPGESATIVYDVIVVPVIWNQGSLLLDGGRTILSDDPSTVQFPLDPTVRELTDGGAQQCLAELDAIAGDPDEDGVIAVLDECPATPLGEPVDEEGCALEQFCAGFDVATGEGLLSCRRADWQNDEGHFPRDCRPDQGLCVPK